MLTLDNSMRGIHPCRFIVRNVALPRFSCLAIFVVVMVQSLHIFETLLPKLSTNFLL